MLTPFLFVVVLDYVLRATVPSNCGVKTHSDATVQDLDFADDIVLLDPDSTAAIRRHRHWTKWFSSRS